MVRNTDSRVVFITKDEAKAHFVALSAAGALKRALNVERNEKRSYFQIVTTAFNPDANFAQAARFVCKGLGIYYSNPCRY